MPRATLDLAALPLSQPRWWTRCPLAWPSRLLLVDCVFFVCVHVGGIVSQYQLLDVRVDCAFAQVPFCHLKGCTFGKSCDSGHIRKSARVHRIQDRRPRLSSILFGTQGGRRRRKMRSLTAPRHLPPPFICPFVHTGCASMNHRNLVIVLFLFPQ